MDTLYSWNARRAGSTITITHSCGKITGVTEITMRGVLCVAITPKRTFLLHVG